jgi:Plasmid pRiA4b ORF-3-like protein
MSLATAVRLNVVLKDVEPKVLRKIAVPVSIRLDRLHLVLQAAFGWENYHLYAFHAGGMQWGIPDPGFDFGDAPIDARKARLCDIVEDVSTKTVHYLYDFGDGWDHVITLDRFFENTDTTGLPMLIEAKGCCPPEGRWRP